MINKLKEFAGIIIVAILLLSLICYLMLPILITIKLFLA